MIISYRPGAKAGDLRTKFELVELTIVALCLPIVTLPGDIGRFVPVIVTISPPW